MLSVLRILDGGQELQVAPNATNIIGWRGTFSGNAQGIKPVRVWLGNGLDLDTMAPAVSEVVFVNELANGLAENAPERVFLLVQYIQILHLLVSETEGFLANLKAVHMRVGPAHHELQQVVQLRQLDRAWDEDPPPYRWLDILEFDVEFIELRGGALSSCYECVSR